MSTSTTVTSAANFIGNLGVNTHLGWMTSYTNPTTVLNCLNYLGVHNIRDYAPAADNSNMAEWATLAAAGVKFDFNIDQGVNIADYLARLNNFVTQFPGALKYIEGPNEIFNWSTTYKGLTGMAAGIAVQQDLFAAAKGDSLVANVPVLTLTTGGGSPAQTYDLLGNLSAYASYGNAHVYPEGGDAAPYNYLAGTLPWETSVVSPSLATVMTEAGYYSMPDKNYGVNMDVQAKYTLDLVLDASVLGVKTTFLYELLDDVSDPGNTNMEDHFGLFYTDGTPKPAATALHNLTTILADPNNTAATGTGIAYTITGMPSTGHSLEMVKASGVADIAVWAEPSIWNQSTDTQVAAPTTNVTVNLGATYASVSIYDPMLGTSAISTVTNASSVTLALTDHPLIVEVTTKAATPPAPPSANNTVVLAGSTAAITDASGNQWTITAGGQIAVNGTVDAPTAGVLQLAYVNGTIWQENVNKLWWSETQPNDSWAPLAGTPVGPMTTIPGPTTGTGTGTDTLVLNMSEDAYLGDAQFNVSVDGQQLGGTFTVTASHAAEDTQKFTFSGDWAPGTHTVSVNFVNDAWGGSSNLDRNLYVDNVTYNGTSTGASTGASLALFSNGAQSATVTDTTPVAVEVPATQSSVTVSQVSATISASSGNHLFFISGHGDTFNLSGGVETITDSGSGGNTFNLPAAGNGSAIFNAAVINNGDVFNLKTALSATNWNGSTKTVSSYLHAVQSGANTQLTVTPTLRASATVLATFNATSLPISSILAHSVV